MPLYEWRCPRCADVFEALVAITDAKRRRRCPRCGASSSRVLSLAALPSGREPAPIDAGPARGRPDVTRLGVPSPARLCWMDDRSAARLAAYKHGRGAEYDDVTAARSEAEKRHGIAAKPPVRSGHAHDHSPLADPAVRARRAAAARRSSESSAGASREAVRKPS